MGKKVAILIAGMLALSVFFVGCNSKNPEDLVKETKQEIANAKYLDADMNMVMSMSLQGMNMELGMDGNIKTDMSGDFPKTEMDMTMSAMGQKIPTKVYMDENGTIATAAGETQEKPFSEEEKAGMEKIISNQKEFSGELTYTSEKRDGKTIVKVIPNEKDFNEYFQQTLYSSSLNTATESSNIEDMEITKMEEEYVYGAGNKLEEVRALVEMTMEAGGMKVPIVAEVTMKYNSIGEKFEITPPSTNATSTKAA